MNDPESDIRFHDMAPAIEFMCWTVVVLVPILRLINGAAVTSDQFVIQVALFAIAISGAIGLRLYQMFGTNRKNQVANEEESSP